jgi:D-alanyl-D-alanine dipeptidase
MRRVPFDHDDPRAQEPMVDLHSYGLAGENYYARRDGNNPPYGRRLEGAIDGLYARQGVAERLVQANRALESAGVELFLLDAYRPVSCQTALWNFFSQQLHHAHPDLDDKGLLALVRTYVSDPRGIDPANPGTWPPHSTGGAVDLVLRDRGTRALLEFGAPFDDPEPRSHTDFLERRLVQAAISTDYPPLRHRRLLFWAMIEAGFANYPYEYWHFDYGDRLYVVNAAVAGHPTPKAAFYPFVDVSRVGR